MRYFLSVFLFWGLGMMAYAQSRLPKSEIGGHLSISRQYQLYSGTRFDSTDTQIGGGARYTYNFNSSFAAEGEVTMYLQKQRQKLFGLFGIKAGKRTEHVGYFLKLRPAFFKYEESVACPAVLGAICPPTVKTNNFAMDIGGVLEMYPSKLTLLRLDVGNLITSVSGVRRNNLQVNLGFSFRF
jgi:hypothetical protein